MPIIKVNVSDIQAKKLVSKAQNEKLSVSEYVRKQLFPEEESQNIFTPAEAVRRALLRTTDEPFTLPDLYTDAEWELLSRGVAGQLGKKFFKHVESCTTKKIEYVGTNGRPALYRLRKEEEE